VTNDGVVAREERSKCGAVVLGGAPAPQTRDEPVELVVAPCATAEAEFPRLDDVDEPIHERV
jgi:hypothetical protein